MIDEIENQSNEIFEMMKKETGGYKFRKQTEKKIKQYIIEYGFEELTKSVYISFGRYLKFDDEGDLLTESVTKCLKKIGGILYNRKLEIEGGVEYELVNLKRKIKNKFKHCNDFILIMYFKQCDLIDCEIEKLEKILINSKKWIDWREGMDEYITSKLSKVKDKNDFEKYLHGGFMKYCGILGKDGNKITVDGL